MPTITASDFRNGVTFEMDGQVMQVVEFQHVKPGKGAAFVPVSYTHLVEQHGIEAIFRQPGRNLFQMIHGKTFPSITCNLYSSLK